MRGERLMLLKLVLEGEEDVGLGTWGLKPRAAGGAHSALGDTGSSPPQKPSTGRDSAYRQRNSRSKSSTTRPLSCSTMLVWAWLQSQVKLGAEGQGQKAKCRSLGLGRGHNQGGISRQLHHLEDPNEGGGVQSSDFRVCANPSSA